MRVGWGCAACISLLPVLWTLCEGDTVLIGEKVLCLNVPKALQTPIL